MNRPGIDGPAPAHAAPRLRHAAPAPRHAGDGEGLHGAPQPATALPSPMSLFGAAPPASTGAAAAVPAWAVRVERLLVGDGRSGHRQVRMALAEDSLPGTAVQISEAGGEWQVGFFCSLDAVRDRLATAAPGLAGRLASRLGRGVCVQVMADPGCAAATVTAWAQP